MYVVFGNVLFILLLRKVYS